MVRALARGSLAGMAALILLAGCKTALAPVAGPGVDAPWPLQREALEKLQRYILNGRVAVAANGQGFSANLKYQQQPGRTDLALDGPLGIGGMRVVLDGDDLGISTSKGEKLGGTEARAVLEQRLGFELPLAQMRWWLLGLPAPGADVILEQDPATGEIRGFTQNGWHVIIQARAAGLGFSLPQRLNVEREGVRLKLLAQSWQP
jgi:outer membrane lipoprotein LolB